MTKETCPNCGGDGYVTTYYSVECECEVCEGTGYVKIPDAETKEERDASHAYDKWKASRLD